MGFKIKKGRLTLKTKAGKLRMPTPFKDGKKIIDAIDKKVRKNIRR